MLFNILVTHERDRWKATTVNVEAPSGLSGREYEAIGREHLRKNDYESYLFVTEHPLPPEVNSKWWEKYKPEYRRGSKH